MSVPKKKIAIFGIKTYPAFAGADRVVENILENIDETYEYYIYLIRGDHKIAPSSNRHFIYLPAFRGKHLRAFSFYLFCTIHMFFTRRYDLIHAHNSDVGLFTFFLKLKYKGKIIGTFHGNPYESSKWGSLAKSYLKVSETLFVKSCSKLTSVTDSKKIVNRNIRFIPNGIEKLSLDVFENYLNTTIDYEEMNIAKGRYLLFACGRIFKSKGLHHLLDAYSSGKFTQQLVILGDFSHDVSYWNEISEKLAILKDRNIIVLKKLLPKYDLFDLIVNSKLVVFPSEAEAMSMMLMEAMACQKLVVCSDIDANTKILGDNYGYLFQNKNAPALKSMLEKALKDLEQKAPDKILQCSKKMPGKYSWKAIVKDYSLMYHSFF